MTELLQPRIWTRRTLLRTGAVSLAAAAISHTAWAQAGEGVHFNVAEYDRANILHSANEALQHQPQTVTSIGAPTQKADPNAYFSEDPEWDGSAKDGQHRPGWTNPHAFTAHRDALVAMNGDVAACVAAWRLTRTPEYANHAMLHLRAWLLNTETRMAPQLDHAGCVPGTLQGTPRGVEDTVMLAETARCAAFLCGYDGVATEAEAAGLREWFGNFALWLNESKPGFIARESKDRLAASWTLQAAECSRFARNGTLQLECLHHFRDKLLRQMNFDGQFPAELHRPDAYAASIFTLDCMSVLCESLSTPMDRLWDYTLPDGRGMRSAVAFLFPALDNRAVWKFPADTEHFGALPVRGPSLLLAGRAYGRPEYIATWKRLPLAPALPALLRRMPARQPALWAARAPAA